MHLNLSLPALWYEAHLVSPDMNLYGVTIPGAPAIVEGITETTAWAFTNTGSDQIDYYVLETNEDQTEYLFDGSMVPFEVHSDTIFVADQAPIIEERLYSRYGPVFLDGDHVTTIRWVGHDRSRSAEALWNMGHARTYTQFEKALEFWDSPMQNILFASRDDTVAIRSTGHLPIRAGADGSGVLDGSSGENIWSGRVPFKELPHSINPDQGYLASANQQPADPSYPYYLGSDWREGYRSLRINKLLSDQERHTVNDIMSYQADVHVVQADHFIPFLDDLSGLSENAARIRDVLVEWDRETRTDQAEPLLFDYFLNDFVDQVWDEPVFDGRPDPGDMTVYYLLETDPESRWFDVESTTERENASKLLRDALESTATRYFAELTDNKDDLRWGRHNHLLLKHLTRSEALRPLWRGPFEYPGYRATLSPSGSRMNTFSASWRVVVDFSSVPPNAYGIYPGGQSGNPFSTRYDENVDT
jgi:penicillin amidase